jgi:hypothetical protein
MSKLNLIEIGILHNNDAIYFPIIVNNRHGIARYPIIMNIDGLISVDYNLLEFYYLNGINAELSIFQYILDKLEKTPTMNHPDIASINATKVVLIESQKLAKKRIIITSHLSYRVRNGVLVAYYSAPFRMTIDNNMIDKPAPANIKCGDTLVERFKFIANFVVNCYL